MKGARSVVLAGVGLALLASACSRGGGTSGRGASPSPSGQAAGNDPARPSPTAQAPARPTGPAANLSNERYNLVARIAPAPAVPGDTSFTLELRGAGHYHVNEQYPMTLNLEVQQGTTPSATLRRDNAAEMTQQVARFEVPVHVTGAGAVVRCRARFAVCSAENCVPETQELAVALP